MTAGSLPLASSPAGSGQVPWRFGAVLAVVLAAHAGLWRWALSEAPPLTPGLWVAVVWRSEGASAVSDAGPSEVVAQGATAAVAPAPEVLSTAQARRPSPSPTSLASPLALSSPPVPRAPSPSAPVEPRAPVAVAQPVSEATQDLADERPPLSAAPPSAPLASAEATPRPAKAPQASRAQSPRQAPAVDAVAPPPLEVAAPPRPAWRASAPSAVSARPVRPEPPPPPRRLKPLPAVVSKSERPEPASPRAAPRQSSPAPDRAKPVRRPAMAAQAAPALQQQPPPNAVGGVAARSTALANAPGPSPVATGATSLEAATTPPAALSGRGPPPAASPPPAPQPSLRNPKPMYPRISQRLGEQGVVHLRARVNERGRVTAVQVLVSSGHARLDEAALAAVRQWSYEVPAGQEMASQWLEVPIAFALRGR